MLKSILDFFGHMFLYLKCEGNKTLDNFARNIVNPVVFLLTLGGGVSGTPLTFFKEIIQKVLI